MLEDIGLAVVTLLGIALIVAMLWRAFDRL
jgi:hypothetical protein